MMTRPNAPYPPESWLWQTILAASARAGLLAGSLTRDATAALDEFHAGGRQATRGLARRAQLLPGMRVLDLGSGLGGPARTLAAEFGCRVVGVDQNRAYLFAARQLTAHLGLAAAVQFVGASAGNLPFAAASFDATWLQHLLPGVVDKTALFAQLRHLLRLGGCLALLEPVAGPAGPPRFPLPWADRAQQSHLLPAPALRRELRRAGFQLRQWQDLSTEMVAWFDRQRRAGPPGPLNLSLILGEESGQKVKNLVHNLRTERIRILQAVLLR